jgi:hypothetical protein
VINASLRLKSREKVTSAVFPTIDSITDMASSIGILKNSRFSDIRYSAIKARIRAERHLLQVKQVKEILSDLQDPETGEFPEISFDRDDEDLVVEVKGTDWLKAEAQKRLASLT